MGPTMQGSPKAGKSPTAARRRGWELFRRGRRERAQHSANTAQAASTSIPFEDAFRLDGKVLGTGINGPVLSAIGRDSRRYAVKAVALGEDESSEEVEIQRDCAGPHVVPIVAEYRVSTARWVSISGERPPPGASAERGVRLLVLPQYASDSFDRWEEDGMALPEDEVKRVAVQLATAVSRLHSRGITHRDIKPENILLESSPGERWSVALADFGMATRDSAPRGGHNCTLVYAAPELVHRFVTGSDAPYTPEVDEWAVGVVIFLLLCGTWPFKYSAVCEDPDKTSLFYNELRTSPSSIRSGGRQGKWDSLSTAGQDAITRLLDPNPSLRLTADELLAHPWLSDSEL
jgi:serine/threonine protein kinase